MADWLIGLIMGLVEGLTEFIPVSSTGHLVLTGHLLGFEGDVAKTFEVVIQLGSILAVVVFFWKRLWSLVGVGKKKEGPSLNLLHIIIAGIPAGLAGVLFHSFIKEHFFSVQTVIFSLIAGGVLMIIAEKVPKKYTAHTLDEITYKQSFQIGLWQCLALCPGFSRSGSTISGGILSGVSHKASAEFTFILAVPMMIAASGLDLIKSWDTLSTSHIPLFATGFITAFVVALFAIVFFLKLLEKVKLTPFAIYRFVLAIAVYIFVF